MSRVRAVRRRLDDEYVRGARRTAVEVCFGDALGVTLFLAALAFSVLTWCVGLFINDVGVFVALLDRVADGHLSIGRVGRVGTVQPGMHYVGTDVYGRNYGQVVASVPAYWLVETLGPGLGRWLVVAGWSGLVAAVGARVGEHVDRRRLGVAAGVTVGAVAFLANAATFRPFAGGPAVLASQVTTMLVAAVMPVLLYRLVARRCGRRLGVLAGGAAAFATPVGFWATVPKRHAFTATLVVVALYALARSRESDDARLGQAGFRGMAYASAGLLAWVHAPEGFTLFLALAVVDLPTAPSNDRRTLAVVGTAFALSLVPFFLTNYLISGNPVEPPRFLPTYRGPDSVPDALLPGGEGGAAGGTGTDGGAGGGDGGGASSGGDGPAGTAPFDGLALDALLPAVLVTLLRRGLFEYVHGAVLAATRPERLVTVFLRWGRHGYEPGGIFFGDGTNLSVVESAPVVAAVAVGPLRHGVGALRSRDASLPSLTAADWFALAFSLLLVALYLPRLPTRLMVTVRYLHPLYPLLVYALFRQAWLADALTSHADVALWGYEATVLLGTPLTVAALLFTSLSKGAFLQAFGLVALVAAGLLVAAGVASLLDRVDPRVGAAAAGLAAGVGTVFLLVAAFVLMHYGPSALPAVETLSGKLRFAVLRYG